MDRSGWYGSTCSRDIRVGSDSVLKYGYASVKVDRHRSVGMTVWVSHIRLVKEDETKWLGMDGFGLNGIETCGSAISRSAATVRSASGSVVVGRS